MKKAILFSLIFCGALSEASTFILGPSVKYGPNGFKTSGASSITSIQKHSATVTTNTNIDTKVEAVMGLSIQTIPEPYSLSIGASYFGDGTLTLTVGLGL